ncbi:hypothetical protein XENOCAPTIV_006480 [Xenoophorus captivus]|uniref:Transmembrane protein 82 n=1 Tax=Xenoophorus captivus TaxID=1517983 RepID=A0ABV0Q8D4_9TELE
MAVWFILVIIFCKAVHEWPGLGCSCLPVVADILCEFLEVAIHLILYVREVYPSGIFQKRKKYNVPVQVEISEKMHLTFKADLFECLTLFFCFRNSYFQMSCHPELNQYIQDTLHCVKPLIEKVVLLQCLCTPEMLLHATWRRFKSSSWHEKNTDGTSSVRSSSNPIRAKHGLLGMLQFFLVTGILAIVGSRVASLVVLEFCLRAISGLLTAGPVSCSLHFLHEGASQRWLSLLLAAALSWYLAKKAAALLHHVIALYKLHSSQRYCGICISLLTSGCYLLPMLCRTMVIAFFVAVLASVSIINQQFLSATEALRFWTPLTICYTLLVVYMQGEGQPFKLCIRGYSMKPMLLL